MFELKSHFFNRLEQNLFKGKLPTDWANTPELRSIYGLKEQKPLEEEVPVGEGLCVCFLTVLCFIFETN
jgi:hypothetical protein